MTLKQVSTQSFIYNKRVYVRLYTYKRENVLLTFNYIFTMETKVKEEQQIALKFHDSKNYPFKIVEVEKATTENSTTEFRVALGNQVVSDKSFATIKDAEKYIDKKPYELIFNSIYILNKYYNNGQNQNH